MWQIEKFNDTYRTPNQKHLRANMNRNKIIKNTPMDSKNNPMVSKSRWQIEKFKNTYVEHSNLPSSSDTNHHAISCHTKQDIMITQAELLM